MTLKLLRADIVGENGHLLTTDGELDWTVVVSREAAQAMSHHRDVSEEDLQKHSGTFLAVAWERLTDEDVSGNRIWVMERDIRSWHALRRAQRVAERREAFPHPETQTRAIISAHALSSTATRSSRARDRHTTLPG